MGTGRSSLARPCDVWCLRFSVWAVVDWGANGQPPGCLRFWGGGIVAGWGRAGRPADGLVAFACACVAKTCCRLAGPLGGRLDVAISVLLAWGGLLATGWPAGRPPVYIGFASFGCAWVLVVGWIAGWMVAWMWNVLPPFLNGVCSAAGWSAGRAAWVSALRSLCLWVGGGDRLDAPSGGRPNVLVPFLCPWVNGCGRLGGSLDGRPYAVISLLLFGGMLMPAWWPVGWPLGCENFVPSAYDQGFVARGITEWLDCCAAA